MFKRRNTINFFLLGVAGSERHDTISDVPAAIPIDQKKSLSADDLLESAADGIVPNFVALLADSCLSPPTGTDPI
jgi:hypothetical protein